MKTVLLDYVNDKENYTENRENKPKDTKSMMIVNIHYQTRKESQESSHTLSNYPRKK